MTTTPEKRQNADCLSAVKERLKSASRLLDETDTMTSNDIQDALKFLQNQQEKVARAEQALMELTEEILPTTKTQSTDKMTTLEVAEALRELQLMYGRQQDRLIQLRKTRDSQKEEIETASSASKVSETDPFAEPLVQFAATPVSQKTKTSSPCSRFRARIQTPFSATGPNLSDVPETDNETDADSTVLNYQQTPASLSLSIHSKRQPSTLEKTKTWPATPQSPSPIPIDCVPSTGRKRRNAFMQLEMCLQRDVHKASTLREDDGHEGDLEDSVSTEKDANTSHDEPSWDLGRENINVQGMKKEELPSGVEHETEMHVKTLNYSIDDDSALYCATVVANKDAITHKGASDSNPEDHPSVVMFTPENEALRSSPTDQTFLTVDEDIERDEGIDANAPQASEKLKPIAESGSAISPSSTETPILERYRLDADENSPYGVKVVPNLRGNKAHTEHDLKSSKHKVSKLSSRYRKTPHPEKKGKTLRVAAPLTIDENEPLAVNDMKGAFTPTNSNFAWAASTPTQNAHRSPLASILSSGGSQHNMSLLTSPVARPRALKLAASSGTDPSESRWTTQNFGHNPRWPQLSSISMGEYEATLEAVKQQVSFHKVAEATNLINAALSVCNDASAPELTLEDIQDILGSNERDSKTIAMALCHWRRLILKRPSSKNGEESGQNLSFVVNISYRASRSSVQEENVGKVELGISA